MLVAQSITLSNGGLNVQPLSEAVRGPVSKSVRQFLRQSVYQKPIKSSKFKQSHPLFQVRSTHVKCISTLHRLLEGLHTRYLQWTMIDAMMMMMMAMNRGPVSKSVRQFLRQSVYQKPIKSSKFKQSHPLFQVRSTHVKCISTLHRLLEGLHTRYLQWTMIGPLWYSPGSTLWTWCCRYTRLSARGNPFSFQPWHWKWYTTRLSSPCE